jgi:hypothetical protein
MNLSLTSFADRNCPQMPLAWPVMDMDMDMDWNALLVGLYRVRR